MTKNTNSISVKNLLFKYQYDIWGHFLTKKKYNNKNFKKMLQIFENNLRRKLIYNAKKVYRFNKYYLDPLPKKTKHIFFFNIFNHYYIQSKMNKPANTLLNVWFFKRLKRLNKLSATLYHKNKKFVFSVGRRLPYVRYKQYIFSKKLETVAYQHFFCFKSSTKFKYFIKKNSNKFLIHGRALNYGSSYFFCLLNQLFLTNIFPTTRFFYKLIKIGGVYVNESIENNPYTILKLFYSFRINPAFLKLCSKYLRRRLRKRQMIINVPNYIDFDYKILSFYIWREPTKTEFHIGKTFPFQTPMFIDKGFNYKDLTPSTKNL